jgi:GntR family transcriptional regulator
MLIRVDPQSSEPIFEQIVFQVKGGVARGEVTEGDRLPSVRELAREVAVNPNTVLRAYDVLEREGIIVRRQGAGCFVTGKKSRLADEEKLLRLDDLLEKTVTEAFHLGFQPGEIRRALERGLQGLRFRKGKNK